MRVQLQENGGCCGLSAVDDAQTCRIERLEIPYYVMNFKEDFQKYVMDYFVDEYLAGTNAESVHCLQPLCKVGGSAAPQSGDRRGLYCHRSLCAGSVSIAKRALCAPAIP